MEALKRLKGAASASSLGQSDPGTPGTPGSSELEEAGSSSQPVKWYRQVRKYGPKSGHPYELKAISLQTQGETPCSATCVEFWPYVGPFVTKRKAPNVDWKDWEGCAAIVAANKLCIGRCTDEDPWNLLWELTIPNDELFHVTWTYHPFTLHPLVVTGGRLGLIYIIDAITRTCFRILFGHGDDILCLTFHLAAPHILASTSSDKTVRIWNILGGEVTPPDLSAGEKLSENYPMAMADEGNAIVAVLAGEGSGGHRSKVVGAAFHPTHRAIATCSTDYTVKIWPLPPFPDPQSNEPLTPRGYRPTVVHFPLFSTSRMFVNFVDSIEWLSDDILMSRSQNIIITWQWLAFRRFFRMGQFEAIYPEPQRTDFNDSHSYMVIARYPIKMDFWYFRPGIHHAFRPTPSEAHKFEADSNLVPDILIAMGTESQIPEIQLFNPSLAKADVPPDPITELRYESEASSEEEEGDQYENVLITGTIAEQRTLDGATTNTQETMIQTDFEERNLDDTTSGVRKIKLNIVGGPAGPDEQPLVEESPDSARKKRQRTKKPKRGDKKKNLSLLPWSLVAKDFPSVWKSIKDVQFKTGFRERGPIIINKVAISPRGAKWIVGVGEGESVFVWGMRDGPPAGEKSKT